MKEAESVQGIRKIKSGDLKEEWKVPEILGRSYCIVLHVEEKNNSERNKSFYITAKARD